ncbi:uncharacterized protein LOC119673266 [Teleopsis dalmanni]|uniref:uncharacterized protein LOC119673266 n=1 Tax=Teleopsis dalmanni TaxID=139649 RepID=UPI0018CEB26C|nr:uncharacterized protein LOC119673266 [Teleopsis dalmanni]
MAKDYKVYTLKKHKSYTQLDCRTRLAEMLQHEAESDEDCEVYFLKPVNEYNIVDKIKEANKELFADSDTDNGNSSETSNANRKVTFAPDLEDYEPETPTDNNASIAETLANLETEKDFNSNLAKVEKFPAIIEETNAELLDSVQQTLDDNETNFPKEDVDLGAVVMADTITESTTDISAEIIAENEPDILEEICEEIVVMDIEQELKEALNNSPITLHRRIMKQATFDCDEEDNKSLTNLLSSDGEAEVGIDTDNEFDDNTFANEIDEDDDDDDNLSIIVASYIPDDYDKTPLDDLDECTKSRVNKIRKFSPFRKRFSMRNHGNNTQKHMTPPEVTDLKLNYKICCEYRNAAQEKLPKYTGYLSEYGLSREQLQQREKRLVQKQRLAVEQTLKTTEDEMRKMQDNERAFTTWLKNKMRFPINKTRNMFDVKINRNSNSNTTIRNRFRY